ncbi:hypothetical protein DV113_000019 [Geotrichum candidum]|uniref:Elongation of fatty acids protein n=1 Tax=Geotrichum candidum TaxID=1173061 RepID=A0A0J9XAQ0_GEOCN|nr:hypothetical protein DV452_002184 [Geotrichum candidum]KAF7501885.1 hypothetical protein DV113_000019 [Geotrichum candidum]KAI8131866.1 hypothetical protein DUD61_004471 [Geotrichum candidum]KAI9214009.1 hypothetical protein DS838_001149 [Geotrichum bryndzae]CDO54556.1 similar to Saccharomyces cerevisiae YCR034W FEN1 Fatty acid elongase required for sphingolipid formation [Geotrichum candidum]
MSSPFEFTIPTVDRPFGFYLWDIISFLSIKFANYDPNTFTFAQDIGLPFSTTTPVLLAIVVYYVVIFGGREVMKNFEPKRLNLLFQIHNLFLTILSLTLFLLLVEQLVPILYNHGILYAICNTGSWTQPIVTVYYVNYITKYLELFDTVFLVLKKKPLTFLHTYHHGATALLCYTQLIGHTSVSWVPIVLNLFVHVIMYWYYFLSASGIRVWWKEWVTRTQIIQFVIDLGFVYFAAYTYFASTYFPWMPNMGSCAGEEFAAIYGCGLLTSYLFLFIAFYIRVYKKSASKAAAKKAAAAAAAASAEAKGSSTAVSGGSVKSRKL